MRVLSQLMYRAPLLAVKGKPTALFDEAVEHLDGAGAERARDNYLRRARTRATPQGLLAGVGVGVVARKTNVAIRAPRVHRVLSWATWARAGRALLEDPTWRARARIRRSPSVLRDAGQLRWLVQSEDGVHAEARSFFGAIWADLLDETEDWVELERVCASLMMRGLSADDSFESVLQLVDDGLLAHDLAPPLVGGPCEAWMRARLGDAAVERILVWAREEELEEHVTLVHQGRCEIAQAPLERAAEVSRRIFALNEVLARGITETSDAGLDEVLAIMMQLSGEGAAMASEVELGAFGAMPSDKDPDVAHPNHVERDDLIAWLAGEMLRAAARGAETIELSLDEIDARTGAQGVSPSTFEMILQPASGKTPWLLGLHGPAGATGGRFLHALGDDARPWIEALAQQERATFGETRLSLSYTPSDDLGDLTCHPPIGERTVALTHWPDETMTRAIPMSALEICVDPAGLTPERLRLDGKCISVRPLARVRSSLLPASVYRRVAADTFIKQHAPWALVLGPLAHLPWTPRVVVEGFVVMPQSWALPIGMNEQEIFAWSKRARIARQVQVGVEDALLVLDLSKKNDREALLRLPEHERTRAFEVWPPLGEEIDRGGRRVEIVANVIDEDAAKRDAIVAARCETLGRVTVPRDSIEATSWRTIKVYCAEAYWEFVLTVGIYPAIEAERKKGALAWFFLPYLDASGRYHLRVRVRSDGDSPEKASQRAARIAARIQSLESESAPTAIATVEVGPFVRETARYGHACEAVEAIFESDSELVYARVNDGGRAHNLPVQLVAGLDALVAGLGYDLKAREGVARSLRGSHGSDGLAQGYRALQSELMTTLATPGEPWLAHRRRVAKIARSLSQVDREHLLPSLVHLAVVRMAGPTSGVERDAYYLWQRALEGLLKRKK